MPTKIISLLLFLAVVVSSQGESYAMRSKKDSIQLKGSVYNNTNRIKGVIVNIYDKNELIKRVKVRSNNRFMTYIPKNSMLTIEITAEDYHTKRFIIDTEVPEGEKMPSKYEFDIDVFKETELAGVNTSFLDFPVGLVTYDKRKEEFIRNKKYTKKMKKKYLKLWAESQSADRQGNGLK